ncbi:hypothetical protein [Helicobacter pylori]|uniref:hypothetical protein n=1 Tax=Helicobacter pylori TaxID=210 RepID=UPI0012B2C12B|nr:hypothetical protein [Helicobacter pylori]
MGFQNENQLKLGALVKATINNKVVEAKVIGIGFNRVTLRSEKGNEVSYAFNSEKFLKWFNHTPLSEVAKNHAESGKKDILESLKIVTSGPSVKERTTTPKEKESKYKLDFDFADEQEVNFITLAERYSNVKRSQRLGELFAPMSYEGGGFQASLIILHALSYVSNFKYHSDAEWSALIENRNLEVANVTTFDNMDRVGVTLFCNVIENYSDGREKFQNDFNDFSPSGFWVQVLPKNKNEALFIAQLLCDGGINKYDLGCSDLTDGLLADNLGYYGLSEAVEN